MLTGCCGMLTQKVMVSRMYKKSRGKVRSVIKTLSSKTEVVELATLLIPVYQQV